MSVFRFLDTVAELKTDKSLTAFFTLRGDEEFLKDHFDGFPVMPGVLLLEALAQAAAELLVSSKPKERFYRLAEAASVRFGQFVRPGNRVRLGVQLLERRPLFIRFSGRIDLADGRGAGNKVLTADFALSPL